MFGRKARCCAKSFVQKPIYEGRKYAGAQFTLTENIRGVRQIKSWCFFMEPAQARLKNPSAS